MKQTHYLIQELFQEHVTIKSILKIITKIADNTNSKKNYNVKDVEGIIDFIADFVIKNHYCKEELLFDTIASFASKSEIDAFLFLTQEHRNETAIVAEIIVALEKCKSISPSSSQVITEKLKNYVDMLNAHIILEDVSIFPLINKILTYQLQDKLIIEFKSIENRAFNNVDIKQYSQFILKLHEKYELKEDVVFF